jgi:hypothetical protein
MSRERDIRNAVKQALVATGAFSDVWIMGLPEDYGQVASSLTAAAIEPVSTRLKNGWDAAPAGALDYTSELSVTLLARNPDPQLRDEQVEQLLNFLINAVNGQSLANFTVPQHTVISSWQWLAPKPPERRISASLGFAYLVSWDGFDTSS